MTFLETATKSVKEYQAIQAISELLWMMEHVSTIKPQRVAELGAFRGGTLHGFIAASADDAAFVTVDTPGTPEQLEKDIASWLKPTQRALVLRADTRLGETAKRGVDFLGGPIDFLFIDADHTYESVKKDFELWSPHVRSGGLIGFHDIYKQDTHPNLQVWRLWNDLKSAGYEMMEFLSPTEPSYGVGLVRKK